MSKSSYYFRDSCRMCGSKLLTEVVSLTPTPPGNHFLAKKDLGKEEQVYPLDLYFCENCHHLQLGHSVNPEILYQKNYNNTQAAQIIEAELEATPERDEILQFIKDSKRGIMKGYFQN